MKHLTKITLIIKNSTILLGLEFKSDHMTKSKALKFIDQEILLDYRVTMENYGSSFKKNSEKYNSSVRN